MVFPQLTKFTNTAIAKLSTFFSIESTRDNASYASQHSIGLSGFSNCERSTPSVFLVDWYEWPVSEVIARRADCIWRPACRKNSDDGLEIAPQVPRPLKRGQDPVWKYGSVPYSTRFQDAYYSVENGLEESRHVFLSGNGLPGRFRAGFQLAEIGFGTGLNMISALKAWTDTEHDGVVNYTGFEAFPFRRKTLRRLSKRFRKSPDGRVHLSRRGGAAKKNSSSGR